MKNTIIQWNCRGIRANYDELQLLLNDYDPAVVCLQETYLKESNNVTFRNYNLMNKFAVGDGRGTGGNTIIINNRCPSRQSPCGTRGRIGPTPPSCEVSKNLTE